MVLTFFFVAVRARVPPDFIAAFRVVFGTALCVLFVTIFFVLVFVVFFEDCFEDVPDDVFEDLFGLLVAGFTTLFFVEFFTAAGVVFFVLPGDFFAAVCPAGGFVMDGLADADSGRSLFLAFFAGAETSRSVIRMSSVSHARSSSLSSMRKLGFAPV